MNEMVEVMISFTKPAGVEPVDKVLAQCQTSTTIGSRSTPSGFFFKEAGMRNNDGWILIHRMVQEKAIWQSINDWRLAETILMNVNWKDGEFQTSNGGKIIVKRGQMVTGIRDLSGLSGLSIQSVRTSLEHLKRLEFLTREPTHPGSVVTVCNYDTYQGIKNVGNTPINNDLTTAQQHNKKGTKEQVLTKDIRQKTGEKIPVMESKRTEEEKQAEVPVTDNEVEKLIDECVSRGVNKTPEAYFEEVFGKLGGLVAAGEQMYLDEKVNPDRKMKRQPPLDLSQHVTYLRTLNPNQMRVIKLFYEFKKACNKHGDKCGSRPLKIELKEQFNAEYWKTYSAEIIQDFLEDGGDHYWNYLLGRGEEWWNKNGEEFVSETNRNNWFEWHYRMKVVAQEIVDNNPPLLGQKLKAHLKDVPPNCQVHDCQGFGDELQRVAAIVGITIEQPPKRILLPNKDDEQEDATG